MTGFHMKCNIFDVTLLATKMVNTVHLNRILDHPFSTHAKFPEKRTCAYQRVRNVSFSENFVYVLNE